MTLPTTDEMKILADELVKASVEYVIDPTPEKMEAAKLARITLHAGIALLVDAAKRGANK